VEPGRERAHHLGTGSAVEALKLIRIGYEVVELVLVRAQLHVRPAVRPQRGVVFYGHSFFNAKDIPFAAMYALP